jgi:tetratricopeptide (TPR) repeat protein
MMRRLRAWYHEIVATLNDWRFSLRNALRDWYEMAMTPFRTLKELRPAHVVDEVRFGGHQFFGVVGSSVRILGELIAGFALFIVRLPINLYRAIMYGPRRVWYALRSAPPRLIAIVIAVSFTVVGAVGATGGYLWWEHRREFQRGLLYRQLDYQMAVCDIDGVEFTLVALQGMVPDDPSIGARLEGIRAREAPLNDPNLLRVVMRTHYRLGDYKLAAREAAKLIENIPTDWEARCMLADEASRRDDRSSVQKHLFVLPRPFDVADSIQPWVAWYSAMLFQRLGETNRYDEMVDFIVLNVLPLLRSKDVGLLEHDAKLLLLECYRLSLTQIDKRASRLMQFWEPSQRACRSILESDKVENRHLLSLALMQQLHLEFLKEFLRRRLISEADFKAFTAEVEERLRVASERCIGLEPKTMQAYVILAEHRFRAGRPDQALATVDDGLRNCGDIAELIAEKAQVLQRIDPQASLRFLDNAVQLSSLNPMMCQVYAQSAYNAGRPDKALEACRQAHKQQPNLLWAHRMEAEICLQLDRPTEAAAALQPIKAFLASDPAGCELYVRTLCACSSFALAEEFLQQVAAENRPVEVLMNAAHAFLRQQRMEEAVRWAKIVLERDTTNARALLIVGDGMRVLAERGARGWDLDKARESLSAYRAVQRQEPENLIVINNIVWLELKALDLPQIAYASSEPLRSVQSRTELPAAIMETLGAVYVAVGRYESAKKILYEAIKTAGPTASAYTYLALAHHGLNQPEMAEKCATQAANMANKTPRETAELYDAIHVLQERK